MIPSSASYPSRLHRTESYHCLYRNPSYRLAFRKRARDLLSISIFHRRVVVWIVGGVGNRSAGNRWYCYTVIPVRVCTPYRYGMINARRKPWFPNLLLSTKKTRSTRYDTFGHYYANVGTALRHGSHSYVWGNASTRVPESIAATPLFHTLPSSPSIPMTKCSNPHKSEYGESYKHLRHYL